MIKEAIGGFCMALADSVPGVSGGTVAFIMGFYDQFIGSVHDLAFGKMEDKKKAIAYLIKLGTGWIIGMGLAVTAVLIFSNLFISLLRNIIPDSVRIPAYIIIIASFVTMIDMLLKAFLPDLSQALGMFIPLIVVNCIIFARAESFASKNPPVLSIADGLGMGLGFTFAITLLSVIRELLGNGTFFGLQVMPASYQPMGIMTQVPGGFITLGLLLILVNALSNKSKKKGAAA